MRVNVSGGISRKEMLLALQKAELTMRDEDLYTGDDKIDKLTKSKMALMLAGGK
ncbi:hypothetical protein LCGC14_0694370 [marine sediment metagenome]|uniref:Uncharacterized protein n=1 Tax=marine sediment metagenome TaxID=412755 RepID=A0A0F9QJS1_9ZZZZ